MGDPKRGDYMPPDESIDGEGAKFLVKGEELYEGEREERLEEELRHQIFKYDSNYIEDPNVVIDAIKRLTPEELNSPVVKDIVKRVVVQGCFSRGFTYEEMNKLVVGLKDLMPKEVEDGVYRAFTNHLTINPRQFGEKWEKEPYPGIAPEHQVTSSSDDFVERVGLEPDDKRNIESKKQALKQMIQWIKNDESSMYKGDGVKLAQIYMEKWGLEDSKDEIFG